MKDEKAIEKVIEKAYVFALLFMGFVMLYCRSVFAVEEIKAYDMMGNLLTVDEGSLVASSDVLFKAGDGNGNEDQIYVCRIKRGSDEFSMPIPMEDGEYLLSEGEDAEIDFFVLDEVYGGLNEIDGALTSVSFIDGSSIKPQAEFVYGNTLENGSVIYLTGARPYLRVSPSEGVNTFVSVSDKSGNKRYNITEKDTVINFSEGSYGLTVYHQDGWGRLSYGELPFKQFVYDCTAPGAPVIQVSSETKGRNAGDNTVAFNANIGLKPESQDALSGIEKYIFRFSDGSILQGTSLVLEPPFEDRVEVFAEDRAGNLSSASYIGQTILLDDVSPVLSEYYLNADSEKCSIRLEYKDDFSGVKKVEVTLKDETVYSRELNGRNVNNLVSEFDIGFSELNKGNNRFKTTLTDVAGNESEYTFSVEKQSMEAPVIVLSGSREGEVHTGVPVGIGIEISHDSDVKTDYRIIALRKNESGVQVWQKELGTGVTEFTEEGYYTIEAVCADSEGNTSRLIRHFTIDTKAPVIAPLDEFNKKILSSFAFNGDPGNVISDYSHVDYEVLLNGQEYDGSYLEEPGKYVLKLVATDELGRSSSEKAEFIISSNKVRSNEGSVETIISSNTLAIKRTAPVLNAVAGRVELQKKAVKDTVQEVKLTDEKTNESSAEQESENSEAASHEKGFFEKVADFLKKWF